MNRDLESTTPHQAAPTPAAAPTGRPPAPCGAAIDARLAKVAEYEQAALDRPGGLGPVIALCNAASARRFVRYQAALDAQLPPDADLDAFRALAPALRDAGRMAGQIAQFGLLEHRIAEAERQERRPGRAKIRRPDTPGPAPRRPARRKPR